MVALPRGLRYMATGAFFFSLATPSLGEFIEDGCAFFRRNPWAGIFHLEAERLVTVVHRLLNLFHLYPQCHASLPGKLDCVSEKVQQDLT